MLRRAPSTLSGGERQRVAIGRALLAEPRALLLDEPLTGLHAEARRQVLDYLRRMKRELGVFTLLVTHHATKSWRSPTRSCCSPRARSRAGFRATISPPGTRRRRRFGEIVRASRALCRLPRTG